MEKLQLTWHSLSIWLWKHVQLVSQKRFKMKFTIADYEKLRSQWGQYIRFEPIANDKEKQLGVRFQNNKLTIGVKKREDSWTNDNCITVEMPPRFADFEARFVEEINEVIRLVTL